MALDPIALGNAIAALFMSHPATKEIAAAGLAQAYFDYASTGTFGASLAVPTTVQRDAMAATLATALTLPGIALTAATGFATALTAFWVAVPVVGAQAGATVGCPGAGAVGPAMAPTFLNLANTEALAAQGMANALQTATLTVTANVAPPPGTVLTIA